MNYSDGKNEKESETDRRAFVAIVRKDKRVLIIKRSQWVNNPGQFALPGGHVDEIRGETVQHAAERELHEEVGVHIVLDSLPYLKLRKGVRFVYIVQLPVDPMIEHNHEVAHVEWMTWEEVFNLPREKLHKSLRVVVDHMLGECDEETETKTKR